MYVVHLALGGCLKAPPVSFGLTADTGGHIAYVLDAAMAQAAAAPGNTVSIVTRLFEDGTLGAAHARAREPVAERVAIERIATADRRYLEKEALGCELPCFMGAFCDHLAGLERRPDVIHAHFADAALAGLAARARLGIPVVYTPHALGLDKRRCGTGTTGLDRRIAAERRAIAEADAIIVSTGEEAEGQLGGYGIADSAARTHCLPPGVPLALRAGAGAAGRWVLPRSAALEDPERPIVLAIARPVRKKNLAGLLRAFAATPELRARANLVILAGQRLGAHASAEEVETVGELRRLGADPRLRGRVWMPPEHDHDDVAGLYARAARGGVFCNPALHEPFGLTLIEAAAAGVPVVATRNGGPAEIVERIGHGLLVDPRDDAAIGAACLAIIGDPVLHGRLRRSGLRGADGYNWDRYAARSLALYATLSGGRAPVVAAA